MHAQRTRRDHHGNFGCGNAIEVIDVQAGMHGRRQTFLDSATERPMSWPPLPPTRNNDDRLTINMFSKVQFATPPTQEDEIQQHDIRK
jgi:hypothetical protein